MSNLLTGLSKVGKIPRSSFSYKLNIHIQSSTIMKKTCASTSLLPNLASPPIAIIIKEHWPILGRSSSIHFLAKVKIIFGHQRSRNIRDSLIKARLFTIDKPDRSKTPTCLKSKILQRLSNIKQKWQKQKSLNWSHILH